MFHFAQPWFLLLLPLVPLIVWRWRRRPRPALRYSSVALLADVPLGRARWVNHLGGGLRAAALVLLVLGLAGLRWAGRPERIPTEGIVIAMVMDVSGSMGKRDFVWNGDSISRLEAVKRAFRLFVVGGEGPDGAALSGRPDDLVSLIAFAQRPEVLCPSTLSHSALVRALDGERMQPQTIPGDSSTNISDAIALALYRLQSAGPRRKVMVLLTDGEHNVFDPRSEWKPRQAAQIAANLGVPVYTIHAGRPLPDGEDSDTRQKAVQTLKDIARITNGKYFDAQETRTLLEVYTQIDGLERERIVSFQYRDYTETFPYLGALAFAMLLGLYTLESTWLQRIP